MAEDRDPWVEDFLDLTEQLESRSRNVHQNVVPPGGGYNPSVGRVTGPSSAQGWFQFINPTWQTFAKQIGVDVDKWPNAKLAPYKVQRDVARHVATTDGVQHWTKFNKDLAAKAKELGYPLSGPISGEAKMADDAWINQFLDKRFGPTTTDTPNRVEEFATPTAPPPGEVEARAKGKTSVSDSADELYKDLVKRRQTNGLTEVNLRNLADIFTHLQSGVGVPYETEAGRLLVQFGLDPKKFGLNNPAYAEEARKAASAALYATMQQAPNLVGELDERKNLKPGETLQPDSARALINNGLLNVAVSEARLDDMANYLEDPKNNNSLYGYMPHKFKPDVAGLQERIYQTLPVFKGGGQIEPPSGRPAPGTEPIVKPTDPMAPVGTTPPVNPEVKPEPSQQSILLLKANPALRDLFDQQYGPGAAEKVLGK